MALGVAKLEKAYRRNPQAPLFAHLAEIYLKKGDVPRALTLCLSGCKLFPDYPTGHLILGRCYEVQGDLEDARKALLRGLLLDPVNPSGFARLARVCRQLGDLPMALKSMQKAADLDAFSETAHEEVEALEEELRDHSDDDDSAVETVEDETATSSLAPASNFDQDSAAGSTSGGVELETPAPEREEAGGDSEPEDQRGEEPAQAEPFARVYYAPDSETTDDEPAKSMKSAEEIQDDIDAFFDTMGASAATPQEAVPTDAPDSSVRESGQDLDGLVAAEETPTSPEAGTQAADLLSLSAEAEDTNLADPASLEGSDTLATLMDPASAADGAPPEATPEADATPASDRSLSTVDVDNDLLVLSPPSVENLAPPPPGPAQINEEDRSPFEPSATAEGAQLTDSFITLGDESSSESIPPSSEWSAADSPVDPLLFIDSNSSRPPESRVADLDGTAPAPGNSLDEIEDLDLEGEEPDDDEIASLGPGEDRELSRLFREIDEHVAEQEDKSAQGVSGDPAQQKSGFATATLAGIYLRQGLVGQALEVYKRLLEKEPENAEIRRKIQELNG